MLARLSASQRSRPPSIRTDSLRGAGWIRFALRSLDGAGTEKDGSESGSSYASSPLFLLQDVYWFGFHYKVSSFMYLISFDYSLTFTESRSCMLDVATCSRIVV